MEKPAERSKYDIDIQTILSDVIHNIRLIIIAMVIGGMLMYVVADNINEKTYSSEVTFVVSASSSGTAYNNLVTATRMANVFSEVFTSDALKSMVADDMGLDAFPGTVEASIVSETNLLVVRVISNSPENAYKALISVINQYPNLSDYMFSNAVLDIIDNPSVPVSAANSISVSRYVKYGVVLAAAFMLMLIIWLSVSADTIKSEKMLENKLETNLFATIYHERKNKTLLSIIRNTNKSLLITNPIVGFYFKETFHKMAVKLQYLQKSKGYKTFLVTSVEENEGKSTVSANIALALAENGHKVLLIDADLRKPALFRVFEINDDETKDFTQFLRGEANFAETLRFDKDYGLYMLFNKDNYDDSSELIASDVMGKVLSLCKEKVDFIIIDSPPVALVSDTEMINELVDGSLLVVRQHNSLAVNINDVIDTLSSGKSEVLGCVFNNVKTLFKNSVSYGGYGYYKYYDKYGKYQ